MKKRWKAILCTVLAVYLAAGTAAVWAAPRPSDWAAAEVQAAIDSALPADGYQMLDHGYGAPISRSQFCMLMASAVGKEKNLDPEVLYRDLKESAGFSHPFSDVTVDTLWNGSVEVVNSMGIVNGVGGGKFDPQGRLTREQAAVILTNAVKVLRPQMWQQGKDYFSGKGVTDTEDISDWAVQSVGFVMEQGLMSGVGDGKFDPQGVYTIEQAGFTVYRLCKQIGVPNMVEPGTNSWLSQYGLARDLYALGAVRLGYAVEGGAANPVKSISVKKISVDGKPELTIIPQESNPAEPEELGFVVGSNDWMRTDEYACHYYMATVELTLTLADGTSKDVTDRFCFLNEGGV